MPLFIGSQNSDVPRVLGALGGKHRCPPGLMGKSPHFLEGEVPEIKPIFFFFPFPSECKDSEA